MTIPGPPLTTEEKRLYVRHLLVPEIGEDGQRRLLATTVALVGDGAAARVALDYLGRAGLRTACEAEVASGGPSVALSVTEPPSPAATGSNPHLLPALATVAGSLAALGVMRRVIGMGGDDPATTDLFDPLPATAEATPQNPDAPLASRGDRR